jgi:hypothetical protein
MQNFPNNENEYQSTADNNDSKPNILLGFVLRIVRMALIRIKQKCIYLFEKVLCLN